ncbi:MAG: cytochrome c3 family protein [Planctomycetes bacterium]|nr:cytochrome c3 family protein [Planctomycetota bacterium]
MLRRIRVSRWRERGLRFLGTALILTLFGGAAFSLVMYTAVHHTAQPEFCNSCHLMEPYYESWKSSAHGEVGCIECHYEPGSLETLEGKFKALSQVAKYVTRTAGTKPWAEVSDQSCMRSGCHSVRMLEGPVQFGRVKFDHRQHLLESQRGRRLRCVTCHSQIMQGQHFSVTPTVCFTCHFKPNANGERPEKTTDCLLCHGPPKEPVEVAGREFAHTDYVARGVNCKECHNPVIQGEAVVRKERCHQCHGEVGHVERIGETAFLHEKHVTEKKVECFECHEEIQHGLLPLQKPGAPSKDSCGACHASPHDAALELYAGTGAVGVPDQPSRMYTTRVVCAACHTGRTGYLATGAGLGAPVELAAGAGAVKTSAHAGNGQPLFERGAAHGPMVAAAGNADCIHCHGTGYDGLLVQWQAAVGEQLDRLVPLAAGLEQKLASVTPRDGGGAKVAIADASVPSVDAASVEADASATLAATTLATVPKGPINVDHPANAIVPVASDAWSTPTPAQKESMPQENAAWVPLREALKNLSLVALDGSRGVHNPAYALAALRAGAERIDQARELLGVTGEPSATNGFPFASKHGCTTCHAGAGRPESIWPPEKAFPHAKHLAKAALDCDACHSTTEHGKTTIARASCVACHHQEIDGRDSADCASCHKAQESMLRGTVAGLPEVQDAMSKMECTECHGEIPTVVKPKPSTCNLCHKPGYDQIAKDWQKESSELATALEKALASAAPKTDASALEFARKTLAAMRADGSKGIHNHALAKQALEAALQGLAAK